VQEVVSSNLTAPTILLNPPVPNKFGFWHQLCSKAIVMSTMTAKVNRSEFYNTIATIRPANGTRAAKLDIWGSVIVAVLLVGILNFMRFVLVY
jgi:hypothetical protein